MSEKRFFGFAEFSTWVSEKVSGALATVASSLESKVNKTDDFGQYKVGELELATLLADLASGADLATLQQGFNDFVAAKASVAEAVAGTDDVKYITAASAKAAIESAVNDLVGSAPEALNTIVELAAALQNSPDVIANLTTLVGQIQHNQTLDRQYVDARFSTLQQAVNEANMSASAAMQELPYLMSKTDTAVNSAKLEGSTKAEVIASAVADAGGPLASGLATKLDRTAQASDSAKLEGVTKAGVIAEAVEAANLGTIASSDIYVSTVDPLPTDGKNGDLWIKYTP